MNKEMQKLLKAINDKKNEVKSLVNDGKLDKAKAAKEELKELQEKFDLLFDLDEEEHEEIEDKVATGTAKTIGAKADKKNLVKAFVNIVKCGFLKREPDEGDVKVYKDALSTDTTKGDDDEMGIGVTVPEDIRTDIIELRRSEDNLEQYVNVEGAQRAVLETLRSMQIPLRSIMWTRRRIFPTWMSRSSKRLCMQSRKKVAS